MLTRMFSAPAIHCIISPVCYYFVTVLFKLLVSTYKYNTMQYNTIYASGQYPSTGSHIPACSVHAIVLVCRPHRTL